MWCKITYCSLVYYLRIMQDIMITVWILIVKLLPYFSLQVLRCLREDLLSHYLTRAVIQLFIYFYLHCTNSIITGNT